VHVAVAAAAPTEVRGADRDDLVLEHAREEHGRVDRGRSALRELSGAIVPPAEDAERGGDHAGGAAARKGVRRVLRAEADLAGLRPAARGARARLGRDVPVAELPVLVVAPAEEDAVAAAEGAHEVVSGDELDQVHEARL